MGRGLSELQRFILCEAGKRKRLYYADVLFRYFKLPTREPEKHWIKRMKYEVATGEKEAIADLVVDKCKPSTWEDGGTLSYPASQRFDPKAIGINRYRSALASLSRACRRLDDRGLVTCLTGAHSHWAGVEITDEGREFLSVNSKAMLPTR